MYKELGGSAEEHIRWWPHWIIPLTLGAMQKVPNRLRRAVGFVWPQRSAVGGILALTLAVGGLNAVEPLVLKSIFDIFTKPDSSRLAHAVMVLVGIALIRELATALSNWLTWRTR